MGEATIEDGTRAAADAMQCGDLNPCNACQVTDA